MEAEKLYEVKIQGRQALLRVRPPQHGRKASLTEIQEELRERKVDYHHESLFDAYRRARDEFVPIGVRDVETYEVEVEVDEDAQTAWLTVLAPDRGQGQLTPPQLKAALEQARVHKGIDYDLLKRILADPDHGWDKVVIARGRPRENGADGYVEYLEPPRRKPLVAENRADYRELNLIRNVKAGEVIARIHHPTPGRDGYDVRANVLRAVPGKRPRFKLGRRTHREEDADEITAQADGYVVVTGDRVSVEDVLEVAEVNSESGNLHFQGVVRVHGQVQDGFVVDARKGIDVGGTVGRARLRSGGDIVVHGGMVGAEVQCEGTVRAKFIQESKVRAGDSVLVEEYLLHAQVVAYRHVRVTLEGKGFITGGLTRAGLEVWTAVTGSEASEERTVVEVGTDVDARRRLETLRERMGTNREVFAKARRNLALQQQQREQAGSLEGERLAGFLRMVENGAKLRDELFESLRRQHELEQVLAASAEGGFVGVFISTLAHPGTQIFLGRERLNVTHPLEAVAFTPAAGEKRVMPYGRAVQLQKRAARRATEAEREAYGDDAGRAS